MKIEVVTRRGIGDVLTTYDLINGLTTKSESFPDSLSDYEISHPEKLMLRRGNQYDNFIKELHYMLYGDKIKLNWGTDHTNFGGIDPYGSVTNRRLHRNTAYNVFADGKQTQLTWDHCYHYIQYEAMSAICGEGVETGIDSNNYAVITTRCRVPPSLDNFGGSGFYFFAKRFLYYVRPVLETLSDNYEKIVVLGEADENFWDKDDTRTNKRTEWPNIYNQIMKDCNTSSKIRNKIVDLTSNNFSLDQFLTENSIMKKAAKVVCFGHGGNYARAMYTGSNLSCLMGPIGWDHALVYQLRKRKKLHSDTLKHLQLFNEDHIENFMESLCN